MRTVRRGGTTKQAGRASECWHLTFWCRVWSFVGAFAIFLTGESTAYAQNTQTATEAPETEQAESIELGAVATAHRLARPKRDVSASVTVLSREEIEANPTLTSDALLRSIPSVATFRRSVSLVADPSSQGLNLRGVGPSGASRSLVLVDGVPANDPFGGWVYFRALPRLGLGRVEVVPGGGSALYGNSALGGVVQLFSRPLTVSGAEADASYGSFHTVLLAARGVQRFEHAGVSVEGEGLRSDGYPVVSPKDRGSIDQAAHSRHGTLNARVEGELSKRLRVNGRVGLFSERQNGGTRFTDAQVDMGSAALAARFDDRLGGNLDLSVFTRLQRFGQRRARVNEDRTSEALSARQRVPADDAGGALVWTSPDLTWFGTHVLLLGADVRHVRGTSYERLFPFAPSAEATLRRDSGGRQLLAGTFVQDVLQVNPWLTLDGALRLDAVRSFAGRQALERGNGDRDVTRFEATQRYAFSPRAGLLVRPLAFLSLRASAYRAFRAPTLNELYRPFQVGTVLTAANPALEPERLIGAETGVEATAWDNLTLRATGYWSVLEDPVTNRTLDQPLNDGAQRQRQNLGEATIRGLELELAFRLAPRFTHVLSYAFVHSRVTEAAGAAQLLGKQLVQNPAHRGTALLLFDDPAWLAASLQVRVIGPQYEDDLNTLRMPSYVLVDAMLSRRLFWRIDAFLAVENLLNRTYLVGRAGVDTIGAPFFARVGVRLRER